MPRNSRHRSLMLAALVLAATAVPTAAFATGPIQDPVKIGPDQPFIGLVNGKSSDATIVMACLGPITPGETGHPVGNQTVEVETASTVAATDGYTGSAGTQIDALFSAPVSSNVNPPIEFTSYFVKELIPTTDVLPCSGSGVVSFVPLPTSATARGYAVSVTFVDIIAG